MVIALTDQDINPMDCKGSLKRVSPSETVFALIKKVADDIYEDAPDTTLATWRKLFLSITCRFELLESDDAKYFRAHNLRQAVQSDYEALAHSDVQLCFNLKSFHFRKGGKLNAVALHKAYKDNGAMSGTKADIPLGFVDSCLTVWDTILRHENMRDWVLEIENAFGKKSPFRSITNLQKVVDKCKALTDREWVISSLSQFVKKRFWDPFSITRDSLAGKKNEKGLIDLLLLKYSVAMQIAKGRFPGISSS